jgi:GH25 family lysozyme M1 (1,4-beta-N-acetylmuramidase)
MANLIGVDISHWQSRIGHHKLVKFGIAFAFVKCGEYYNKEETDDDKFAYNIEGLDAVGIPHGLYYFYHPGAGNDKQLRHFERLWKLYPQDFPPALDCEAHDGFNPYEVQRQIKVMLEGMERIAGRQPIIYTTASWWSYYAGDPAFGADYKFWLAQYNVKMDRWTATIKPNIIMWQFTDKLAIPGCPSMDGNYWMAPEAEFYAMIDKNDGTIPYQVEQIAANRVKKNIFALSRKNRRWLENITR